MVEQGDIVKLHVRSYFHYVVTKRNGKYLLLSLESLNRREEFVHSFSYEPTNINVKDLNLEGLVKSYIEDNNLKTTRFEFYKPGKIVKSKTTNKIYGCVIVNVNENEDELANWMYYLIDLNTFVLTPMISFNHIQEKYDVYDNFDFHDLKIKLK